MKRYATKTKIAAADKAEFRKRYARLAAGVKAIKAKLKDALKDAGSLAKDARELYDFGDARLYAEDGDGRLYPAFRGLDGKMDKLAGLTDAKFVIGRAVEDL